MLLLCIYRCRVVYKALHVYYTILILAIIQEALLYIKDPKTKGLLDPQLKYKVRTIESMLKIAFFMNHMQLSLRSLEYLNMQLFNSHLTSVHIQYLSFNGIRTLPILN